MHETITLHIGSCGIQTGKQFYQSLMKEHSINNQTQTNVSSSFPANTSSNQHSNSKLSCFFQEVKDNNKELLVPRAIWFDLDSDTANNLRSSEFNRQQIQLQNPIISTDNTKYGYGGTSGTYCSGLKNDTNSYAFNNCMEAIRQTAEKCDSVKNIQIFAGIGGGTSGAMTSLSMRISEQYHTSLLTGCMVLPSEADSIVSPYNAVLCLNQISFLPFKGIFMFDNTILSEHCMKRQVQKANQWIGYDEMKKQWNDRINSGQSKGQDKYEMILPKMNKLINEAISGITVPLRFESIINSDMRSMCSNLIPFERIQFLSSAVVDNKMKEQSDQKSQIYGAEAYSELNNNMNLLSYKRESAVELASYSLFRNQDIEQRKIFENIKINSSSVQSQISQGFPWLSDTQMKDTTPMLYQNEHSSVVKVSNSTAIVESFKYLENRFDQMFRRKCFLFGNYHEMDEMEFTEAQSNLQDLIGEYEEFEKYQRGEDNQEEEEEGEVYQKGDIQNQDGDIEEQKVQNE